METRPKHIEIYRTQDGKRPFLEWFDGLKDERTKYKITTRLDRVEDGNFGECNSVGQGAQELKINYGPGYRIYFGLSGQTLVILLCGGDKKTQKKDIKRAQEYWADWRENG